MAARTSQDASSEDIPSELQDRLSNFDDALSKIEEVLDSLHSVPLSDIHAQVDALDKAKLDLIGVFAINSLFWMYLNVIGENPKEHHVKTELDRIRGYLNRVKEIQDKKKAPKLDKAATKRFVRSALWQKAHQKAKEGGASQDEDAQSSSSAMESTPGRSDAGADSSQSNNEGPSPAKQSKMSSPPNSQTTPTEGKKKRKRKKNKNKS